MAFNYNYIQQAFAGNGGKYDFGFTPASTTTTAATANSGFFSFQVAGQNIGSTWPNIITGLGGDKNPNGVSFCTIQATSSAARGGGIARIYRVGTLNLTTLGNSFTHDSVVFPLSRNEMGQASIVQSYIPFIKVTTALSGVAAQFQIKTSSDGPGYLNQEGLSRVGTKTFIFPSATTSIGSCFFIPLNNIDTSCRDIIQITVTTASTTGQCEVYMLEELIPAQTLFAGASVYDHLAGAGLDIAYKKPADPISGEVISYLVAMNYSASAVTSTIISYGL